MAIATAETVLGSATSASSVATASWTPAANDLILVWVACRSTVTVSSVSGNGITFVQVLSDTEGTQAQCTLSLWRGMSASPSAGQITATLSGTANAAVIVAHRITGADTGGTNGSGAIGASAIANTGATDTASPSVSLTTTAANSRVYGGATHRNRTYTVGTGETAISLNNTAGTAGDITSLSTEYQDVASAGSVTIDGALSAATDWIQGAVEVKVLATAAKSATDSAALSDASSAAAVATPSDSAAGSESSSLTASPSRTESASGSDASAVVVVITLSDAGSLSESASVANLGTVVITTDAGSLSDASSVAASTSRTDSASASDASSVLASSSRADAATLSEAAQIGAGRSESGAGSEASSLVASLSRTESGALGESGVVSVVVVLYPWARHTFTLTADDLTRTTRRDTVFSLPADDLSRTARRDTTFTIEA